MNAERKIFDWQRIHLGLDRTLSLLKSSYEQDDTRARALLQERSVRLARPPVDRRATASLAPVLVFRANGERYGIAIAGVREIFELPRMAALPGSSDAVLGIVNWRGEFVAVADVARLLGVAATEDAPVRHAILMRGGELSVALAITGLEGITRLDLQSLQSADRLYAHRLFRGITQSAVLLFDEKRLLERLHQELHSD